MFGLGPQELLIILVIVLIIFGGKRLPEIGSALGKSIREFKKASSRENDEVSSWIKGNAEAEVPPATSKVEGQKEGPSQKEENKIPGIKEAEEIKKTANKIKAASRFFLKK